MLFSSFYETEPKIVRNTMQTPSGSVNIIAGAKVTPMGGLLQTKFALRA